MCNDFGAQENKICHCFHFFPIYLPWSNEANCHDLRFFNVEFLFFSFIFISWRLITLQYCSGFCHTVSWISHGFTCVPHPDPPLPPPSPSDSSGSSQCTIMLSFKPAFSLSSFTVIKRLFSSSLPSAIRVVSFAYLRLLIFLPAVLTPGCDSSILAFLFNHHSSLATITHQ